MTVESIRPEHLEALAPEWRELWRRCPSATPFQSPEWLLPWARHHAPGRCAAVAVRCGRELVGLAPVFCWNGALLLAGTGPSDHGDALLRPGAEAAAPALLAALPGAAPEPFARIDLQQLPPASPLLARLPPRWREERPEAEPCFVAPLADADGLGRLSSRRRSNWRYSVRRIERQGGRISLARGETVAPAMQDLIRLHALRWEEKGEPGVLADPLLRRFLGDAAARLERSGLLRLWQLEMHGDRIAVLLVLAGGRTHHYYIGGFDPAHARLSPSTALIGAAMSRAHGEGATAFDFLRGAEPYKRDWAAEERPMQRRILYPR